MSTNPYNDDKRLLELLERWQSGDFSRANEQELRALTDSDEFRRETVAGFWSLPEADHVKHLASLRTRLRERVGVGRRVAFPQILAAVAAIGLLVLAVIWLIPSNENSAPMAQQEADRSLENQSVASNFPPEASEDKELRANGTPQLDRMSQSAPAKPVSPMMDANPTASGAASEVASAPPTILSAEESPSDKSDQMFAVKPSVGEAESGKVMDEKDDVDRLPGNIASRSEATKESPAPTQAKDSMKKKASAPAKTSQPSGGWSNFQDYLRRNARLPEAARQNNVTGTVRLKFRLDEKSQPVDFQTLLSLGYGCDEEAIRLVKAYSWQRGSDQELTLDVSFVR